MSFRTLILVFILGKLLIKTIIKKNIKSEYLNQFVLPFEELLEKNLKLISFKNEKLTFKEKRAKS